MNKDISRFGKKYENLIRESAELDEAINQAFEELLGIFDNHYPVLNKVSILELSVDELAVWMESRLGNP